MTVFDVAQHVVNQSGALIEGSTPVDGPTLDTMGTTLEEMDIGPLFGIFLQSFAVKFLFEVLSILIWAIVYGRMIGIYLTISFAPILFATFGNREQSMIGQNYLRSIFVLGFQEFLITVCVAIYAVLVQTVSFSSDIMGSLWNVLGITLLITFTLFKTDSIAGSVFYAH